MKDHTQRKRGEDSSRHEDTTKFDIPPLLNRLHAHIFHLQRTIGNQAVQQLVQKQAHTTIRPAHSASSKSHLTTPTELSDSDRTSWWLCPDCTASLERYRARTKSNEPLVQRQSMSIDEEPRSLSQSLDTQGMTASEVQYEIGLIREWLKVNQQSSEDREHLLREMQRLQQAAQRLQPQPRSLNESLSTERLSNQELEQEVILLRQWLHNNPDSPDHAHLAEEMNRLEKAKQQETGGIHDLGTFKRMVRQTGKTRMLNNIDALAQWARFIEARMTPDQLRGQMISQQTDRLMRIALHRGTSEPGGSRILGLMEQWTNTKSPGTRAGLEPFIEGQFNGPCMYCHVMKDAPRNDHLYPDLRSHQPPTEQLGSIAKTEQDNLTARPDFASDRGESNLVGSFGVDTGLYPGMENVSSSIDAIRPFLEQLGPKGYDVLPEDVINQPSAPDELKNKVLSLITQRQEAYREFIAAIEEPDFDYLILRPIVRDLLMTASQEVRDQVQDEIETAEAWALVKFAGLAVLSLLTIIFPPTTALGVGLLATASIADLYSGIQSMQQGQLLSNARGAHDVVDPEQQEAATMMIVTGVIGTVAGALGATQAAVSGLRLVRSGGVNGTVVEIEAKIGENNVKITNANGGDPQVMVTNAQGKVEFNGSVAKMVSSKKTSHLASTDLPGPEDIDDLLLQSAKSEGYFEIPLSKLERNPNALPRLSRELGHSSGGNRLVYRVEGAGSRDLLAIDSGGNVNIAPDTTVYLNFGSLDRALEFLAKRGSGARIVAFEVEEAWVKSLRSAAIPERGTSAVSKNVPRLVDVRFAEDQMGIPGQLVGELQQHVIPGSGRVIVVKTD